MGGVETFIDKLASFSHFEEYRGIKDEALEMVPIDTSFLVYVLENYEKLVQAGLMN